MVLSRELGDRGAIYFQPSYVGNSNLINETDDDYTVLAGVGARLRFGRNSLPVRRRFAARVGVRSRRQLISFGFEQRYGGHVFQLNFSNGFATTLAQVARGGTGDEDWYLGFNLIRKFF